MVNPAGFMVYLLTSVIGFLQAKIALFSPLVTFFAS